ncbi:hypothetical protein OG321_35090 [Streptomyces sp. NBC_00424]|nr:hypothetical protein [Streptomyces sp. NBC_00424]MCX5077705.1 hypothetical protein [Streptomyces sp. NBC_00424]
MSGPSKLRSGAPMGRLQPQPAIALTSMVLRAAGCETDACGLGPDCCD